MTEYNVDDVEMLLVKRNHDTGQVILYRFPKTEVKISTMLEEYGYFDNSPYLTYIPSPVANQMQIEAKAWRGKDEECIMEVREIIPARPKRKRNK